MASLNGCRWSVYRPDPEKVKAVADAAGVSRLFAKILIRRGLDSSEAINRHMTPSLDHIHDPCMMKGMDRAVERIVRAVDACEQVAIYGDYDADGITALSVLKLFLESTSLPAVAWHVPDRITEGYGVHLPALQRMKSEGITLIITVDCGITAIDEIAWARDNSIDVIVTDHHTPPETLPPALAIINPKCDGCAFPYKGLAGVGVAFNLVVALRKRFRGIGVWEGSTEPNLREYLDLVALGTVADVVPLNGENRVFVTFGLKEIDLGLRPGIQSLKEVAGLGGSSVAARDLGFRLA
ncbi:DHH family phosphoesterase, partial [Thermodesulfobacteriota bacterium]